MCGILDNNSYYSLSYDQRTYCTWPLFHLLCHDLSAEITTSCSLSPLSAAMWFLPQFHIRPE